MKMMDTLQQKRPRKIELEVKPMGRRTLDWLEDPEGEARRIWNAVRRTETIPANALSSRRALKEFLGQKSAGLKILVEHFGFYDKVLTFEKSSVREKLDEIRDAQTKELLKSRLIGLTLEKIRQQLPDKYTVGRYKSQGQYRVYIRDRLTGRFVTHFKWTR